MMVRCLGWAAPHVPPVVLTPDTDGDPRVSDGICPSCDAVLALLDAPSSPRVTRFVERLEYDRDRAYISGSVWSARDRQLRVERIPPLPVLDTFQIVHDPRCTNNPCTCMDSGAFTMQRVERLR